MSKSQVKAKNPIVILESIDAQDKLFKSIATKGATLQKEMHQAACSVLWHVGKHGDIRRITALLAAFPDAVRSNAARAWFEQFGPVTFENNKPVFVKGKATQLGEAMDTPFWKFKPEASYTSVDVVALLSNTIKKLLTDQDKTEGADHRALIATLEAQVEAAQKRAIEAAKPKAPAKATKPATEATPVHA